MKQKRRSRSGPSRRTRSGVSPSSISSRPTLVSRIVSKHPDNPGNTRSKLAWTWFLSALRALTLRDRCDANAAWIAIVSAPEAERRPLPRMSSSARAERSMASDLSEASRSWLRLALTWAGLNKLTSSP